MILLLNWIWTRASVLAFAYWLAGWRGVLLAPILFELYLIALNVVFAVRQPKSRIITPLK